jgi:hypothetical protein
MASPANSTVQNLLPVQAYFNVDGSFNTFIGQGVPFYATANPIQSGLTITNSTINSTTIGALVPSTGVFSSGQVNATPVGSTDIANKLYVDSVAAGLSWKQPVAVATLVNITLSGLQVIDGYTTLAGNRVLVKNQSTAANNGIYIAASGVWARSSDANTWNELIGAITFIEYGTQASLAYYCSAQPGGTLGVTAVNWASFSVSAIYTAGTGLTLTGYQFSITNTGVSANTYGSASAVPVIAVNAQGQITSATTTTIAITNTQVSGLGTMSTQNANAVAITGGSIDGTTVGATTASTVRGSTITATTQFTGAGTGLTGTATSLSIGGTAALATSLAGGLAGSLPYQSGANATTFLSAGTNGQVLTLASGVPAWANAAATGVTSVSGTGTVNGITLTGTVTSSGSITLGGTLGSIANSQLTNSSITFGATSAALGTTVSGFNAVTIGATTASTGAFTYLSTSNSTNTTPVLSFNGSNTNLALGATVSGSYLQAIMQNKSATAGASVNYVLSNDSGTDSTYYGEFGMNSSVFSASTPADFFSINNGIYFSGHDGDISVGSGNGYKTYLVWGSTGQSAHVINATGAIGLSTNLGTTPALSGTTGFGTAGQVLTSQGSASAPTWTTVSAALTVTDDTTTNSTRYLTFTSATSGSISAINTSSTKLTYNPSTGAIGATQVNATTGVFTGSVNTPNTFGFKNRIINGNMVIDQRNAGASTTPSADVYLVDRWVYSASQASKFTWQQNKGSVTLPTGFINYLGGSVASAVTIGSSDYFVLVQKIEGLNIGDLGWGTANAKTVTLSFQIYSSLTGTFGGSIINSANNRSYPFTYTISSANTWTSISITIAGDTTGTWLTTNGTGMQIYFGLGVGSTYSGTSGSWSGSQYLSATGATSVVGTASATFYITGVQLETGSQATSFDFRDYGREIILCQRYYEKSYAIDTVPATSSASGSNWFSVNSTISGYLGGSIAYKVIKRTTPTVTFYSYTGTAGTCSDGNAANYTTVSINGQSSSVQFGVGNNSGSIWAPAGNNITVHWTSSAEL